MRNPPLEIALFGGTFDPPHVGHVLAAHYVLLTAGVDRVFVAPCGEHALGKQHASFQDRLAMCRLAFRGLHGAEVIDIEGSRPGPSFTIDTVRELAALHPGARLTLVIGSDLRGEIAQWKESAELLRMTRLLVLPRLEENTAAAEAGQSTPYYLPRVSSTGMREMLTRGAWDELKNRVPAAVLDYIRANELYR